MQAMNALESKADRSQTTFERFDEAGMLLVNDGEADIGVNFKEQVDWAYRGFGHHEPTAYESARHHVLGAASVCVLCCNA